MWGRALLARLIRLDGGVSLELALPARVTATPAWRVREVERAEVVALASGFAELAGSSVEDFDAVAPSGWRCFAAERNGVVQHLCFVETRPGHPVLFGSVTRPTARGSGALKATALHIAGLLAARGEPTLYASTSRSNHAAQRAFLGVGFRVAARSLDVVVLGTSVRSLVRRALDRVRAR
jgi:hypothetical protein